MNPDAITLNPEVWRRAIDRPLIAFNEVHIWRVDLFQIANQLDRLSKSLSADENLRANQYRFEVDRRKFVLRRSTLRRIIASYLRILPHEVEFRYTSSGQPVLAEPFQYLRFSLTHSGNLVLIAIAMNLHIGVDVEAEHAIDDIADIVCHYFSKEERLEFFSLPADERTRAFYCGWTRKEAFLKAIGQGLAFGLDNVTVTLNPREPARLVTVLGSGMPMFDWSLYSLIPLPGYTGALAVSGMGHGLAWWELDSTCCLKLPG